MYFCFLFTLFILYLMLNNYFTDIYLLPKKKFPIMCSNYCMRIFEKQCNSQKIKNKKTNKKTACLSKKKQGIEIEHKIKKKKKNQVILS